MPFDCVIPIYDGYDEGQSALQSYFGDESPKPQLWFKKCTSGTREYFSEYCNNTSLHGLKYVGGEKRSRFEKVMWTCLFLCSVSMCSYMIYQIHYKWVNTPVIVSFSQMPSPVGSVPFPAVTICPQNKAKQSVHNFTRLYLLSKVLELRDDEVDIFNRLKVVCDYLKLSNTYEQNDLEMDFDDDEYYDYEEMMIRDMELHMRPHIFGVYEDESLIDFLMNAAPSHSDIFHQCIWNAKPMDCEELFHPTLNEDGICYTFNMVAADDLFRERTRRYEVFNETEKVRTNYHIETGYDDVPVDSSYPYRTIGAGIKAGLEVELRLDEFDFDYICKTSIQGFKILLHDPITIPRGKTKYIRVPIDQEITIAVQPNMVTTAENLVKYLPSKRYCYFQEDRKLNFFKNYTQQNCELECLGRYILNECRCVPFYIPRMNTTNICGHESKGCVEYVERSFLRHSIAKEKSVRAPPCKCYPACFSIDYVAETTQATFEWWKYQETLKQIKILEKKYETDFIRESYETSYQRNLPPEESKSKEEEANNNNNNNDSDANNDGEEGGGGEEEDDEEGKKNKAVDKTKQSKRLRGENDELHVIHYTSLKIFFKDYQFTATERSELYGFFDFVANIGGLLGLFTGFSFLSLMEILYYFSIRAWINKCLFGRFLMETPADPDEYRRNRAKEEIDEFLRE